MINCPTCGMKLTCQTCAHVKINTKQYKDIRKGVKITIVCKKTRKHVVMASNVIPPDAVGYFNDVGCYKHSALQKG